MSDVISPEELAEDYKSSLEDLTQTSRWEITNLTVIAKENIHAAQAISKVVEEHIQKTGPPRKLPAIYLLDSVAKNVGTPYTLFFGRNLYRTFMDAYSLVEPQTRRKLEEMLQTWKQPVPGSSTSAPVFPPDITRKIDNALIKARTAAVQAQQQQMKKDQAKYGVGQPSSAMAMINAQNPPHRNTPTPPGQGMFNPPRQSQTPQLFDANARNTTPNPAQQMQYGAQFQPPVAHGQPALTSDSLYHDIASLIQSTQRQISENHNDPEAHTRLKALHDLQGILSSQQLPPNQLALVRDQVSKMAGAARPQDEYVPPPAVVRPPVPAPPTTANLAALLGSLPQAQANLSLNRNSPMPPMPMSMPIPNLAGLMNLPMGQIPPPPPPPLPVMSNDLINQLMSSGLLNINGMLPPPPLPSALPLNVFQNMQNMNPTPRINSPATVPSKPQLDWRSIDIELNSNSLKKPRPYLLPILNESLPGTCSSCARRFASTETGKKEKAAHLDWHFRVSQRLADASNRGSNRSWYIDEEEWIKTQDTGEDTLPTTNDDSANAKESSTAPVKSSGLKDKYVPVPNDPSLAGTACPICNEKFETVWHEVAEEWVWMDAVKVAGRIFHASCHEEVSKDAAGEASRVKQEGTNSSRDGTPEGGSDTEGGKGKRKAEDLGAMLKKIKRERV